MGLHDWAEHTINAAVNWRQVLARALRHSLHTHTGASDYTWQRPARRQDPDDAVIRPAMAAPTASITVVLDTSGSMGQHEHAKAFAEINAILTKAIPGQAVRVLSVDEDVNTDQHITQARQIHPRRRPRHRHGQRHPNRRRNPTRGHHRHHRRIHPLARDPTRRRPLRHRRAHSHLAPPPSPRLDTSHRHLRQPRLARPSGLQVTRPRCQCSAHASPAMTAPWGWPPVSESASLGQPHEARRRLWREVSNSAHGQALINARGVVGGVWSPCRGAGVYAPDRVRAGRCRDGRGSGRS